MISKLLPLIIFLAVSTAAFSQEDPGPGTVTVFSEDGAKFTLYVNGAQANSTPDSRVVFDMKEVPFSFRIVFQDSTIPEISKRGIRLGKHCLFAIVGGKRGYSLKVGGCTETPDNTVAAGTVESTSPPAEPSSAPEQLSATYKDGVISINDGRKLKVTKAKVNGLTYPRIIFTALQGSKISLKYDNAAEQYEAESPMQYEVKDFQNNNSYVTVTVDEGGPAKTWHVKLQNSNGFDLKIEE